jgi:hypothetical protein
MVMMFIIVVDLIVSVIIIIISDQLTACARGDGAKDARAHWRGAQQALSGDIRQAFEWHQERKAEAWEHQGGDVDPHDGPDRDLAAPEEAEGDPRDGHGAVVVGDEAGEEEEDFGLAPPRRVCVR